jgi:transposase
VLCEFYANAVDAFPVLTHKAALEVLRRAPTPAHAAKLTLKGVVVLLRRSGRGNRAGLAEAVLADLHRPCLRQPPRVEAGLGVAVVGLVTIIDAMRDSIAQLEAAMTAEFDQHPSAELLRGVPGLGPVLAARVLAEIGDDPARFTTADGLRAFAGTAPITRASGRSRVVRSRHVKNKRLADACHWWAFASITKSPGARIHYDKRRAAGDSHNAALRNLANKLLGRLWWCLQHDTTWDDQAAWTTTTPAREPAA